jgi:RNA polymerase sigma-70 factor, ECF subfamily
VSVAAKWSTWATSTQDEDLESELDDHQLMERVAEGDNGAFRLLVQRHTRSLHGHAVRMLQNQSEAEEVVQEALVRLWKQAPSYRPEAKVKTFVHGIAHNLCIDRLRARKPRDDGALDRLVASDRTSGSIDERERSHAVHAAVSALPERQRAALSLVHFEELSNIEAAALLDVSVEALESLLARARRTLREKLAELMSRGGGS